MGCAQWIDVQIVADDVDITVDLVELESGQIYDPNIGRKPCDISHAQQKGLSVRAGRSTHIASCGASDRDEGTKGRLHVMADGVLVGQLSWDCAELFSPNTLKWEAMSSDYHVEIDGGSKRGAALGDVTLVCARRSKTKTGSFFSPAFKTASFGLAGL